jgi:hypothetical protein
MNTAAKGVYYDVDNINAKKESFDHFEANEIALCWRSIAAAKQVGSNDHLKPRKSHKEVVKLALQAPFLGEAMMSTSRVSGAP